MVILNEMKKDFDIPSNITVEYLRLAIQLSDAKTSNFKDISNLLDFMQVYHEGHLLTDALLICIIDP